MPEHEQGQFMVPDRGEPEIPKRMAESNRTAAVDALKDIISPEHLRLISDASGGFTFDIDPNLSPGQDGYTNLETRQIFINPETLKNQSPSYLKGFFYHEAGHHAPDVQLFQEQLLANLKNPDVIPESYRGNPRAEEGFLRALHSHLHNALADIWDESYMSRYPYAPIRKSIDDMNRDTLGEGRPFLKMRSKPEQLVQLLVGEARYDSPMKIEDMVDSEVYQVYQEIVKAKVLRVIEDNSAFESFPTAAGKRAAIARKFAAYQHLFLPKYLELVDAEIKERQEQKASRSNQNGHDKKQPDERASTEGQESVPSLTREEIEAILNDMAAELEEAGKEFGSRAPSQEEQERERDGLRQAAQVVRGRHNPEGPKTPEKPFGQPEASDPWERWRNRINAQARESAARARRGMAESKQVQESSVREWQRIRAENREQILSLASVLADVFLDDRRKKVEYMKREGEIVPGLESETITSMLSGETDPNTKMKHRRNPEFIETEIEWIVDTSGSMAGKKLSSSIELIVIVTEAFKQVKEDLEREKLIGLSEDPLRLGVTKFSDHVERITRLSEPISGDKELKIIDRASRVGGGTEESEAIRQVYQDLQLGKPKVIKIMFVLTDGAGNQAGVRPIVQQIERDDNVIFMAIGLGDSAESARAIVDTYLAPIARRDHNIHGLAKDKPEEVLSEVVEFIKREVYKRK